MTQTERIYFRRRSYQMRPWRAMRAGCTRFVEVLHRRAGKDRNWLSIMLEKMLERRGVYFDVYPSLNQGRRDAWDNIVHEKIDGVERSLKMMDMFPEELVKHRSETEMQIELHMGSIYQVMGADDEESIKRLRGPNPVGLKYSEYAHMLPSAWTTMIPVLEENGGWAAFVYTPNGENHGKSLHEYAMAESQKDGSKWFHQLLTIDDTRRDAEGEDGSRIVTPEQIDELRRQGIREEFIQQEFYCSFTGFTKGTIYGDLLDIASYENRIAEVPYVSTLPVGILMDIGTSKSDATAIWFYQRVGEKINFIDYHEDVLKGAQHYARVLKEERRYMYGRMVLPWDGKFAAGDYFTSVGFRDIQYAPRMPTQSGIDLVRQKFSQFYFDKTKCSLGLTHLKNYKRKYDDKLRSFIGEPVHDEHSHAADSLRMGAQGGFDPLVFFTGQYDPVKVITEFDPRTMGGGMKGPWG